MPIILPYYFDFAVAELEVRAWSKKRVLC